MTRRILRERVEALLKREGVSQARPRERQVDELLHELVEHRTELEMQNDELLKAQDELMAVRDRYRALYREAPVGYVTLDETGRIREVNRRAGELLGQAPDRLCGVPLASFLSTEDADVLNRHSMRMAGAEPDGEGCDVVLLGTPAPRIPVHITSTPEVDELGHLTGFRSVIIDRSALCRAEDCLRGREARSEALGHELVVRKPFGIDDLAEALVPLMSPRGAGPGALPRPASTGASRLSSADQPRPKLLVVEDDSISGPMLVKLLRQEGYEVTLATSAADALASAKPFDLVVADVALPDMAGERLADQLRERQPGVPVVFTSGLDEPPESASAFVPKPIDFDTLVATVERLLQPS